MKENQRKKLAATIYRSQKLGLELTPLQIKMAMILLAINGLENALGYVAVVTNQGPLELF